MRTSRRWTTAITILSATALAVPVAAAEKASASDPFAAEAFAPYPDAKHGEREKREKREPRGPFHPLDGRPDYGTAENAFGASRSGHIHAGHDVFAPAGTPLVAVSDGIVAEAGSDGSQGNYLYLYDPERERTYVYMHMIAPANVKTGERVKAGERVGALGCTGSCWGDHLHFEVRAGKGIGGEPHDPLPLLKRWDRVPHN
jgi:murein DD-endopeptidase MepM/ murein hydrolase activator NlpD